MNLYELGAVQLSKKLGSKEVSACEVVKSCLDRISAVDDRVGAFLTVLGDRAMQQAQSIDNKRVSGDELHPLAGVPIAVKDNICTKDIKTTCASKMLENFVPPYSATVFEKLENSGLITLGKVNLDEFAMGSSCENSALGVTRNPRNLDMVAGGSSGGSAAAVAAGEAPLSLGTDTGGSIRQPASFTGIVGLKPTYGSVSRYGLVAFASSLDQIGPMARSVEDTELLYSLICGADKMDATTVDTVYKSSELGKDGRLAGVRIGIPKEYFGKGVSQSVHDAVMKAAKMYEDMGAQLVDISLASTPYALSAYYIIASAEASSNLARYDGVRYGYRSSSYSGLSDMYEKTRSEGFGAEVKRRIMLGTFVLSSGYYDAYYKRAKLLQNRIRAEFSEAFNMCDVLLTPTAPFTAFGIGDNISDPIKMYATDICTVTVNIAGLPALSVPCGNVDGLPVGMQLIGRHFCEATLFAIAGAYERAVGGFSGVASL